ncbi:MAG TPA: sugar phosphate isomerase/epimerase [Lacunisphaera sp.]|jgi:sugar phosphate isomerase/epimerase
MPQFPSSPVALSRRRFLAFSSIVPAALLAGRMFGAAETNRPSTPPTAKRKVYPIGLELYSVRTELARDLPGTLSKVAAMGYEVVEFYAPYFEWTVPYAKEVRSRMQDLGLKCFSTHNHIESFTPGGTMAKAIELNQVLGTRYLILASTPKGTVTLEDWKNLCGRLSTAVRALQSHGLTGGFHNHQTEWAPLDGGPRVMDVVADNTPAEFALQFDVGTCMEAGADPIAWIKAHPGRIRSVHLKDWAPGKAADEKSYRVLFGEGVSPWREITAAVEATGGVEYYLMEQEGSRFSEFETAKRCLDSWRKFRGNA